MDACLHGYSHPLMINGPCRQEGSMHCLRGLGHHRTPISSTHNNRRGPLMTAAIRRHPCGSLNQSLVTVRAISSSSSSALNELKLEQGQRNGAISQMRPPEQHEAGVAIPTPCAAAMLRRDLLRGVGRSPHNPSQLCSEVCLSMPPTLYRCQRP